MKVSVVINAFNHARFVEQAVDSVLYQNGWNSDCELIVIDDGSSDDTPGILDKYRNRIKYLRKKNEGQASAINLGVSISRGHYISLLDSDDWWRPEKLSVVLKAFAASNADAIGHNLIVSRMNGTNRLFFPYRKAGTIRNYLPPTSGMTFRRASIGFFYPIPTEFRISADMFIVAMANVRAVQSVFLCQALGYYRMHGDNLFSGKATVDRLRRQLIVVQSLHRLLTVESNRASEDADRSISAATLSREIRRVVFMRRTIEVRLQVGLLKKLALWTRSSFTHELGPFRTLQLLCITILPESIYAILSNAAHWIQFSLRKNQ